MVSAWGAAIYLRQLGRWLFNRAEYQDFITSPFTKSIGVFAPVGSQVLGANIYGSYYPHLLLSVVNYASILLTSVIFILIYGKIQRAVKSSRMAALAGKAA